MQVATSVTIYGSDLSVLFVGNLALAYRVIEFSSQREEQKTKQEMRLKGFDVEASKLNKP